MGRFDDSSNFLKRMLKIKRSPTILAKYAFNLYKEGRYYMNESRRNYEKLEREFFMNNTLSMSGYARVLSLGLARFHISFF